MKNPEELVAGVIGLGTIGGGVATSLANSKRALYVFDVVPDAYQKHPGTPAPLASPAAVAEKADIIMIAVFNYAQCLEVLSGENGILSKAREGMVIVCLSTLEIDECKELGKLCAQHNVGFIDAGVSPGSRASQNGLVAMCGAEESVFNYALPVLNDWSAKPILCGPIGSGMTVKVIRNFQSYSFWRITTEAARLCMAANVDIGKFLECLTTIDEVENLTYNMLRHRTKTPDGKLPPQVGANYPRFMLKDLGAARDLKALYGLELPVLDQVYDLVYDTCDTKKGE